MVKKIGQFAVIFAVVLIAYTAAAQNDERPKIVAIRVGFDNHYKVGQWTPVKITLRGGKEQLTGALALTVPDGDGVPSRVTVPDGRPVMLLPGMETSVLLYARFGRVDSTAEVNFIVDGRVAARREFKSNFSLTDDNRSYLSGMEASQRLYLVVGSGGVGVDKAVALANPGREDYDAMAANISDLEQLPTRWYGYEGVDAVILSCSRPEIYAKLLGADDARLNALDEWIRMGGRLVLAAGAGAEEVFGAGMPLERFAPGKLERTVPLRHGRGWESYADGSAPFPKSSKSGAVEMSAPRFADIKGKVEALEADLPLVIRTPRGFGQIVFIAADLDRAPMNAWAERPRLIARLLQLPVSRDESNEAGTAMMHYGYEDIAGQLRSALDRFSGVRLVPFGAVVGLVLLYIILIGPVDYFFLKKIVGRMQWTWVTFPAVVLFFCVGAYYLAYYLKGNQLRVNRVDLVDVDASSGFLRGTSWANIFSPRMETYEMAFRPHSPDGKALEKQQTLTAWLGLPGSGLGGMNQPAAVGSGWQRSYDFAPSLDAMSGVPIQVWSTKSITGRWRGDCKAFPQARLSMVDDLLDGSITNTLDFPLRDCLVVFDRWVYQFDAIQPGETVRIADSKQHGSLQTLLTGRRSVMDDKQVRQQATPYSVESTDINYILRQMMFFKAAGGKDYSNLTDRYQSFVDFSDLIALNRAVLVAYGPKTAAARPTPSIRQEQAKEKTQIIPRGGADLLLGGEPVTAAGQELITVYRFVFEVSPSDKNAKSN